MKHCVVMPGDGEMKGDKVEERTIPEVFEDMVKENRCT
jgi:hypothetical protein